MSPLAQLKIEGTDIVACVQDGVDTYEVGG